jgi:transcriptional regulator with XRE-family HTH domain
MTMQFGEFLRYHRKRLDLTQADVAESLTRFGYSISSPMIGHWETGRNKPPINEEKFRLALALTLSMDITQILSEIGFAIDESQRSDAAQQAALIVDYLPVSAKQLAIDYLEVLKKRFLA